MLGLLSFPTWLVHIGSITEWLTAMALFYYVGKRMNNVYLRRMPWVMIPYMLSGLCAIIYHISSDTWNWVNEWQTYLTFIGSCCFAAWAFLLLRSLTANKGTKEVKRG